MGWFGAARLNSVDFPECRLCEDTSSIDVTTGSTPTIDGVVSANGNVVLLLAQSTVAQNGPWVVNATGAWTRPTWFSTGYVFPDGLAVVVQAGDVYADSLFATNTTGTVGTNDPLFQNTGMSKAWITSQLALKVAKAGDTMTGALVLEANATLGKAATEGVLTFKKGDGTATTATLSYTKWNDLETVSGIVKCNGSGDYSAASDGTDYLSPTSGDLKYVELTGDTMTGPLVLDNGADGAPLDIKVNNPLVAAPMTVDSAIVVTNLNADKLDGYDASNSTASIPISNGTVNTNLNADLLDGQHGTYYAPATGGNYLPLAGGTLTGNVAMNKTTPEFSLTNTNVTPNIKIGLRVDAAKPTLYATVSMATKYGKYVDFNISGTNRFATSAAISTLGTKFFMFARQYSASWGQQAALTISKDVGSSNFIPHGGILLSDAVYMSRWTGAARETVKSTAYPISAVPSWHTVGYYFDDVAGKCYCSVDGQPWVEASTGWGNALWTSPWAGETFAYNTTNGTTLSAGEDTGLAKWIICSGTPTDADATFFYNGGAGQTNDAVATYFGADLKSDYYCDESGVVTTLTDSVGGCTLTASGDVEGKLYPSTETFETYPYLIESSAEAGVRGNLLDGDQHCWHYVQGKKIILSPFSESTGLDVEVAEITETLINMKKEIDATAAAYLGGTGKPHAFLSDRSISLFSGQHDLSVSGNIDLFSGAYQMSAAQTKMFSGTHEFTNSAVRFFDSRHQLLSDSIGLFSATPYPRFSNLALVGSYTWSNFVISTHTLTQTVSAYNGKLSTLGGALSTSIERINSVISDLISRGDMYPAGS